jgi:aldose 1-epimerase
MTGSVGETTGSGADPGAGPEAGSTLVLEAAGAKALVCVADGGRLGSLVVDGRELLVDASPDGPIYWGAYPMAPWAGRIRRGTFAFAGVEHHLPITMPPHAIHGVVYDRPWTVTGPDTIAIELDARWPFRGRVTQRFRLDTDGLEVSMTLEADEPQPVVLGWHPWFRRVLGAGDGPARLAFEPGSMLLRDAEGISGGERVTPPAGPWDDCFTDLASDPVLEWPGRLRLTLSSTCRWWVVYTMPEHAICVEPQSGPPDAVTIASEVVVPGAPLTHVMRWRWERLGA